MSNSKASIIQEFRSNGGIVGGEFEGAPLMLLHHLGAKSGTERVTPVGCFPQADGSFSIVASNGGAPTSPNWYYNLMTHPKINVEFGTEIFAVAVTELEAGERDQMWADALRSAPQLEEFQGKTLRAIPVLLLTRIA